MCPREKNYEKISGRKEKYTNLKVEKSSVYF